MSHDAELFKCGDSENTFSFESYGFSNNRPLFLFPWERRFAIGNSGTRDTSTLHHQQTISGEEMHTLITFMVSVMASNIVDGL